MEVSALSAIKGVAAGCTVIAGDFFVGGLKRDEELMVEIDGDGIGEAGLEPVLR